MADLAAGNRIEPATRTSSGRWGSFVDRHFPYLLVVPTLTFILLVIMFPLAYSFAMSFTNFSAARETWRFIGVLNYERLFEDPVFFTAIQVTATYVVATIAAEVLLGYVLALLLSRSLRGAGVVRTAFMLPMMIAPVLAGFQFRFFFNDQFGMLNNLLFAFGLIKTPLAWLGVGNLPMISIIIASVWKSTPFVALVLLAGLLALPREPFEAAEVDGASSWQRFRHLTFPLMLPLLLLALSVRLLDAPRVFDLVYMLTEGGPAQKTEVLMIYVYTEAWQEFQLGFAAAASYVIVLIQMILLAAQVRLIWKIREWR